MSQRVLFVDRQVLFREAIAALCQQRAEIAEAATAGSVREAVNVLGDREFDVVSTSPRLLDGTPFDIPRRLRMAQPEVRVLVLDDEFSLLHVRAAVQLQVFGYWTKGSSFEELCHAMNEMVAGRFAYCPSTRSLVKITPRGVTFVPPEHALQRLSHRELEVLFHLARGKTLRECAEVLQLSPSTIDNHKTHMMRKLGVRRTVELVSVAYRNGLLD